MVLCPAMERYQKDWQKLLPEGQRIVASPSDEESMWDADVMFRIGAGEAIDAEVTLKEGPHEGIAIQLQQPEGGEGTHITARKGEHPLAILSWEICDVAQTLQDAENGLCENGADSCVGVLHRGVYLLRLLFAMSLKRK